MTTENGRMLGRYQLLFMLGQGGMGEVHLARLTGAAGFEKLCIVKTVLPNLMGDQNFIDRFHHEARVLVQLTHSNIAQVHDMGDVDGTLYMAIEYVAGVDLSRVETRIERQQTTMPLPMALYIAQQICEALGYAHRKVGADGQPLGIVHRDVSPQNVMVSYEGEVKVIDFGLAKSTARSKHTLPSTVMGKLGYMSPEQALAKTVDHRSDIFSAGIVVWEMIAGRSMYGGGTMSEMVAQMAVAEVPSLSAARPEVSPALEQIVMRALAKDPTARYQRADDFARALNELAVREQMTVGAEEVGNYVRAMCPEEFAAERQLQSKLSVMRRKGVAVESAPEPELEGTFMRPSGEVVPKKETASGQVMTPAQRAMSVVQPSNVIVAKDKSVPGVQRTPSIAPPRAKSIAPQPVDEGGDGDAPVVAPKSKLPIVIAALVVLIALAGGAVAFMPGKDQTPREPTKEPVAIEALDAGGHAAVAVVEPVKTPDPVKEPEEPQKPTEVEKPVAGGDPVALEQVVVEGKVWKVLRKNNEDVLLLEKQDKLAEGDRINLVGEEVDGKRPVFGRAAVLEKKGSIAVLLVDDDVKLPEKVFAARDSSPKRPKKDPSTTKADPVVAKVDPEPVKTEPIGKKDVEPIVKKDPEPVKEPEVVKPQEPTKPAANQLFGSVRVAVAGIRGNRAVFIQSQSAVDLTNCELRLPSNQFFKFGSKALPARGEYKLPLAKFSNDSRPADPQFKNDWAAMYCREGTGYWKTTYER